MEQPVSPHQTVRRSRVGAVGAGLWSWCRRRARILSLLLVLGLIAVFVDQEREHLPAVRRALVRADWRWLLIAVAAESGVLVVTILTYSTVLRRVGHRVAWWPLVDVYARSVVAGTLAPIGAAGSVVAMRSLTELGVPVDDAVLAWTLADLTGFSSSLVVLLPTIVLLWAQGSLPGFMLIGAGVLAVLLGVAAVVLTTLLGGNGAPPWLVRRLPRRVGEFVDRARAHRLRAPDLLPALAWGVAGEFGLIAVLGASLHAVDQRGFPISAPLIGYEVGNAAQLAAPIYQGIGAVELAVTVALGQQRIRRRIALAATLLYRVGVVWLPLAVALLWRSRRRLRAS